METHDQISQRLVVGGHHNKGLFTMSSTRTLRTRTPWWFPDPRCRTSDRQPTPSGPTKMELRRGQTKTEIDEDGDGRRRRQTKTKKDSLWGRAKWQLPYSCRPPRVTKAEADEDEYEDRRRQTHSWDERSGSSLTAADTPE